ncbi:hypothetical protein LNTAR_06359 [Lentisphaera araneosa HTCC2155]|uniref:Uncharacterized protein n=1 Tax=Lentisphaera araneosa HTCC2155 TaxID=313628 RepID=A6DN98_9BACT|nr:hypothetical protein [Lentisphaera araneosa]EDM26846.1 hypothetical protein LNTAR_06359 [Lentisphaera araneosa HTCC2155]
MKNTFLALSIICNLLLLFVMNKNSKDSRAKENNHKIELFKQKFDIYKTYEISILKSIDTGEQLLKSFEKLNIQNDEIVNQVNLLIEFQKRQKELLNKDEVKFKISSDPDKFIKELESQLKN